MSVVRVESMAYGGYGVVRIEGLVHFVPGTAPGDLVEIEPESRKKSYCFSRLIRIIEPSPARTEPFCADYEECGGCQLQHIQYSEQLKIKQKIFAEQMRRIGGFQEFPGPEIVGSDAKRVRMRFQVRDGAVGLFRRRTHDVCEMAVCGLASDEVNAVLMDVRGVVKKCSDKAHGSVSVLSARGAALATAGLPRALARNLWSLLGERLKGMVVVDKKKRVVLGEPYLEITVQGCPILVPPDSFWQVNPEINERVVGEICGFMQGTGQVFDLYCGCGNMLFPLSQVCGRVVGIERDAHSVEAARQSASRARIGNVTLRASDVLEARLDGAEGLVLDPPRSGLPHGLVQEVGRKRPHRIAYLSCNPSTLARDARRLVDVGYSLASVRLFDMFPHTYHIESLSLFELV